MRILTGLTLGLALLGSAYAATGRTTNKTYATRAAAAKATGAYLFNRAQLGNGVVYHASNMTVGQKLGQRGKVQTLRVTLPKTLFGYPAGEVDVKVEKVKGGWKGYTNTAAKPVLWK